MPADDVYEATIGYIQNGEKMVNVFHLKQNGSDGAGVPELSLTSAIHDNISIALLAVLSQDCFLESMTTRRIFPTVGGRMDSTYHEAGTVASDVLPPQNNVVVSFYNGNLVGPRFRNRMHIPGVPDSFNQDGIINATTRALYATLGGLLCGDLVNAAWTFHACFIQDDGSTAGFWTYGRVEPVIRVMRGRRLQLV